MNLFLRSFKEWTLQVNSPSTFPVLTGVNVKTPNIHIRELMTSNDLSRWHRYRKCGWSPYERVDFTKITGPPEHHQERINALSKRTSQGSTVSEYLSWNSCATRNLFQISVSKHLKPLAMLHSYACVSSRKSKPGWVIRIAWRKMSKSSIQSVWKKHVWKMKRQQLQFKANINI